MQGILQFTAGVAFFGLVFNMYMLNRQVCHSSNRFVCVHQVHAHPLDSHEARSRCAVQRPAEHADFDAADAPCHLEE
jgi:hypothetical protein